MHYVIYYVTHCDADARNGQTQCQRELDESWPSARVVPFLSITMWGFTWFLTFAPCTQLLAQSSPKTRAEQLQSRPLYQATQQALDALTRAEVAREEAVHAGTDQAIDVVRVQCREAIVQLRSVEAQLRGLLQKSYQIRPSKLEENSWSTRELESLSRNLNVQLARAYRNQALCYPTQTVDHVNALSMALELLGDLITQPLEDASVWQARIEYVVCLRLIKNPIEAQKQIDRWTNASPPADVASRFTGESLKIDLEMSETDRALAKMNAIPADTVIAPETDEAIMEVILAARQKATSARMTHYTNLAIRQLGHIRKTHGAYWHRRAEIQFGLALATKIDTNDPALLGYAAAGLYATGQPEEAVKTYDRIATLLAASENADRRFEIRKTAAAIVREMNQFEDALVRFRQLALDEPQHAEATKVHLIAIGLAAELSRTVAPAQRGIAFERYLALLSEHLESWPKASSAQQVHQWLERAQQPKVEIQRAQTLATMGMRTDSISLYRKLTEAAPNDADLLEAYAVLLATGTDEAETREALRIWKRIEKRSKPGGPRWSRGRRARLTLLDRLGEGEKAKQLRQLTEILYPDGVNDE